MTEKRHEKVQVWAVAEGKGRRFYLLLRYNESKGGYWQPVTGSVEEGETLEQAALREAWEETGFRDEGGGLLHTGYVFEFHSFGKDRRETVFALRVPWKDGAGPPAPAISDEHTAFRWCTFEEALELARWDSNKEGLRRLEAKLGAERPEPDAGPGGGG